MKLTVLLLSAALALLHQTSGRTPYPLRPNYKQQPYPIERENWDQPPYPPTNWQQKPYDIDRINWEQEQFEMDRNNWQQKPYEMRDTWEPDMEVELTPAPCDNQRGLQIIIKTDQSPDNLVTAKPRAPPCRTQQQKKVLVPRRPYNPVPYRRPWSRSPEDTQETEKRGDDFKQQERKKEPENQKIMFTTPSAEQPRGERKRKSANTRRTPNPVSFKKCLKALNLPS